MQYIYITKDVCLHDFCTVKYLLMYLWTSNVAFMKKVLEFESSNRKDGKQDMMSRRRSFQQPAKHSEGQSFLEEVVGNSFEKN